MAETNNIQPATKGALADLRANPTIDIEHKCEEINQTLLSICAEVVKFNLKLDRFENNFMEELRIIKSDLLSAFEASVMKGQLYSQKAATHGDILSGHEEKLLNHETRIASLEKIT